ncbi:cupin domain-containing protein [Acrocarpospora macrocephala]|uniref:XRE family transcriptional regulator n=1 Tax=Acrocarpospora macrocephala TaxID=150177 RepID=A0A5M3WZ54_9ACTN|nr:cupin domain-containing protein [Acrocarpospora macrocephala]GES14777.1 XRE family transcriptional regulator [Acrocarpospora macrocephala]
MNAPDAAPPAPNQHSADQTMAQVGARIRVLRSRRGLTLKEVAERTGISTSMLSMLERGVSNASVGTLVSVASALGLHMYDLFDRPDQGAGSPVTRLAEQTLIRAGEGTTRRVAHNDTQAGVELAVNTYEPGGASGPRATHHGGREFGVVVSGSLTVELDGEIYELAEGDVIAYPSTRPHRIVNSGPGEAVAVWINID